VSFLNSVSNKKYIVVFFFITTLTILTGIPYSDANSVYRIEYFVSINYIPVGSIDVTVDQFTGKISVRHYHVGSYRNRQLAEAVVDLIKLSQNLCKTGKTGVGNQALTYFVENSTATLFVVKADRSVYIRENVDDAILEIKSYYPSRYCIPLFCNIQVYKNGELVNELRYTIVSSNTPLPGSKSLNTGLTKLTILTLSSLLTVLALAVISRAGRYRII
jgi:hypothetical protein